jgi:pimeloyl-ACP methyl ester carboxylesterase
MRWPGIAVVFLTIFVFGCGSGESRRIKAGDHSLFMRFEGTNGPAVVFESGGEGTGIKSWSPVQSQVARFARTVSYDRAGCGHSEGGPSPRSARQIATELRTALLAAKVQGPYILVGHSAGASYIRLFADQYPEEVRAFVFVDPYTEYLGDWFEANVPRELKRKVQEQVPKLPIGQQGEHHAAKESQEQLRKSKLPARIPAVVLSSGRPEPEHLPGFLAAVLEGHRALAGRFSNCTHQIVKDSGHALQNENPELVVKAIKSLVTNSESQ